MKNLKRLIALVAVFALALTTIASAAAYTDVKEDSAYYEAIETLSKLNIFTGYEDGTFQPDKTVTRAEMAALIARIQGYGDSAETASATKFSDVPSTHWASGYIANATGVAIDGYPDGTFGPDETVKYEQAVKMIMATLGYTVIANGKGGYPMGYVSAAISEKVTAGVSGAAIGADATRGMIAQLLVNAIDTPIVEQTTWNNDGTGEYTKYDGTGNKAYKTLMSENLDVVKMKGVVTENSYAAFGTTKTIDKDEDKEVVIDYTDGFKVVDNDFFDKDGEPKFSDYTFLVGDTDAEAYLGMAVIFYTMENDNDKWKIISIVEDTAYNKSVTFSLADYSSDDTDANDNKLAYTKNNSSSATKLKMEAAANLKVLYNNVGYTGDVYDLIDDLAAANYSGEVTVYDTNKTSGYDMVVVEAAVSAVVDEVSKSRITLKDGVKLPLQNTAISRIDTDDDSYYVVLLKDGKEITVDQLAKDDVLSIVAAEKDSTYQIVEVATNTIEGTVEGTRKSTSSFDGKAYKIDGTYYDLAAGVSVDLKAGDSGKFYIDKFGKIAYYDETVSTESGTYAYVIDTLVSEDDWSNKKVEIKVLNADGVKTLKVADTFHFNRTKLDVDDAASTDVAINVAFPGKVNDIKGQIINYTTSGSDIKKIYDKTYDEDEKFGGVVAGVTADYDAEDMKIGTTDLDKDTVVFFVEGTDSKCSVGTIADLDDKANFKYDAYKTKKADNDANILVAYEVGTSVSTSANLAVVIDDIDEAQNAAEEDVVTMTLLYKGQEVTYTTDADTYDDAKDLEIGDVIAVKVNGNGIVTALNVVASFTSRDKGEALPEITERVNGLNKFFGDVAVDYNSTSKKITLDNGKEVKLSKADYVYVIDPYGKNGDIKEIYAGSAADFSWDKALKDFDNTTSKITVNGVEKTVDGVKDFVFVRDYDSSDVVEVVIVKGYDDYKIQDR